MFGWEWRHRARLGGCWAPPGWTRGHSRPRWSLNARSGPAPVARARPALAGKSAGFGGVPSSAGRDPLLVILKPENGASVSLPVQGRGGYYFTQEVGGGGGALSP